MAARDLLADSRPDDSRKETLNRCLNQYYADLRGLARARIRRMAPGRTLQTSTLVQEAVLRLQQRDRRQWARRTHFFADVKQAMRDIVVEYIRRKQAVKHGGHLQRDDDPGTLHGDDGRRALSERKLTLARALETMYEQHPEAAAIVVLRHVHGLTVDECAATLGIAPRTVARKWVFARTWLKSELARE